MSFSERHIVVAIVFSLVSFIASSQLHADDAQWLIGVSAGTTTLEPDTQDSPFRLDQTGSSGYKFYLGYDINNKITIEGFWSDLGEATFTNGGALSYSFYGLGGSYYFPENSAGSAIFVKAGVGQIDVSGDVPFTIENSVQLYLGGGLEVQFDNGFSIRGEYEYYDADAQFFSLSLNKRFGQVKTRIPKWAREQGVTLATEEPQPGPQILVKEESMSELSEKDLASSADEIPAQAVEFKLPEKLVVQAVAQKLSDFLGVVDDIAFTQGSAEFTDDSLFALDLLALSMKQNKSKSFVIIGHTDNSGDAGANKKLSLRRAQSVGTYLQSKGVAGSRLRYLGAGGAEPISLNSTPEGRKINRRIEILLN